MIHIVSKSYFIMNSWKLRIKTVLDVDRNHMCLKCTIIITNIIIHIHNTFEHHNYIIRIIRTHKTFNS